MTTEGKVDKPKPVEKVVMESALTAADILKADDLDVEAVNVPEWGGIVYVRTMTGTERDTYETNLTKDSKKGEVDTTNVRAQLAVACVVDEVGKRLFSENQAEELGRKSAKMLSRVASVAQRLNGITDDEVEELAKNSKAVHSDNSVSD